MSSINWTLALGTGSAIAIVKGLHDLYQGKTKRGCFELASGAIAALGTALLVTLAEEEISEKEYQRELQSQQFYSETFFLGQISGASNRGFQVLEGWPNLPSSAYSFVCKASHCIAKLNGIGQVLVRQAGIALSSYDFTFYCKYGNPSTHYCNGSIITDL